MNTQEFGNNGFVYRYVHKTTLKWYIGSHNGSNPKYSGSGTLWCRALNKYGEDAFVKDILYVGPDFREIEELILTELDAQSDPMSYNLKNQAYGASLPGKLNGMYGKTLTAEQKYACGRAHRGKTRPDHAIKMTGENNPMFGKNYHITGLIARAEFQKGKSFDEIFGKDKSSEVREKMSKSHKGKKHNLKSVKCPHCGKEGKGPNMARYHFDKCKLNTLI